MEIDQNHCWGRLLFSTLFLVALSGGCEKPQGAPKYPVKGSVLVNGNPAEGVVIRFYATGNNLIGKDRSPVAVSDAHGDFQLSTFKEQDGSPVGDFAVTFRWPVVPMVPTARDRLGERYARRETSTFHVTITASENQLPAFELTAELEVDPSVSDE